MVSFRNLHVWNVNPLARRWNRSCHNTRRSWLGATNNQIKRKRVWSISIVCASFFFYSASLTAGRSEQQTDFPKPLWERCHSNLASHPMTRESRTCNQFLSHRLTRSACICSKWVSEAIWQWTGKSLYSLKRNVCWPKPTPLRGVYLDDLGLDALWFAVSQGIP